jgi:hypothetical protein
MVIAKAATTGASVEEYIGCGGDNEGVGSGGGNSKKK